ncbi:MAG: hypothetical protein MUO60_00145, partial [Clostridiaceae bacterium]|nr:hypothetical protein [Clostridiaceae bacterium]
ESKEELIEKYNTEFSKNLIGNTYTLFSYIFETIDSRLLALKKENQKINYEIAEENILFSEKSTPKINYVARRANFPNGSQIIIFCILGKFNRGMVSECPTLEFDENFHDNKVQSFRLIPNYGGIKASLRNTVRLPKEKQVLNNVEYMTTGEAILTEQVKKQFDETFKKFIQLAYTR